MANSGGDEKDTMDPDDRVMLVENIALPDRAIEVVQDKLEKYFGNKTKSGGGDIEKVEITSSVPLKAQITFHEDTVLRSVLPKEHTIFGQTLRVMRKGKESETTEENDNMSAIKHEEGAEHAMPERAGPGPKEIVTATAEFQTEILHVALERDFFEQVVATFDVSTVQLPMNEAVLLVEQYASEAGSVCKVIDNKVIIKGHLTNVIKFYDKMKSLVPTQGGIEGAMATYEHAELQNRHSNDSPVNVENVCDRCKSTSHRVDVVHTGTQVEWVSESHSSEAEDGHIGSDKSEGLTGGFQKGGTNYEENSKEVKYGNMKTKLKREGSLEGESVHLLDQINRQSVNDEGNSERTAIKSQVDESDEGPQRSGRESDTEDEKENDKEVDSFQSKKTDGKVHESRSSAKEEFDTQTYDHSHSKTTAAGHDTSESIKASQKQAETQVYSGGIGDHRETKGIGNGVSSDDSTVGSSSGGEKMAGASSMTTPNTVEVQKSESTGVPECKTEKKEAGRSGGRDLTGANPNYAQERKLYQSNKSDHVDLATEKSGISDRLNNTHGLDQFEHDDDWEDLSIPNDNAIKQSDRLGQGNDEIVHNNICKCIPNLKVSESGKCGRCKANDKAKEGTENSTNQQHSRDPLSGNSENQENSASPPTMKNIVANDPSAKSKLNVSARTSQTDPQRGEKSKTGRGSHQQGAKPKTSLTPTNTSEDEAMKFKGKEIKKCYFKENYYTLHYVQEKYNTTIKDIGDRYKVIIDWKPGEEKEIVYFYPIQGSNRDATLKAKEEFTNLVEKVKTTLQSRVVDYDIGRVFLKEEKERAGSILKISKEQVVAIVNKEEKKYIFLSENADVLQKVIDLFCESLGIKEGTSKQLKKAASDQNSVPTKDKNVLMKQATIGEDILEYIFHVHQAKLSKEEKDLGVVYERKGGDLFVKPKAKNKTCKQDQLEKIYDKFASFVQSVHSQLTSKDVDIDSKQVSAKNIQRAIGVIHSNHKQVLIKKGDGDKYRIFGEANDIKVAISDFYKQLGMLAPHGRHTGAGRRHGNVQRSYSNPGSQDLHATSAVSHFEYQSTEGTKVSVLKGDITKEDVDVICNAANKQLDHGGGVAGAIVRAGGKVIQDESYQCLAQLGRYLTEAEHVYTNAGKLPCQWVLHVVGPRWKIEHARYIRETLYSCCLNILKSANEQKKAKSIAIPAIGTGIYGVPKRVCAQVMCDAVFDYIVNQSPMDVLRDIRFIDIDADTVETFTAVFKMSLTAQQTAFTKPERTAGATDGAARKAQTKRPEGTSVDDAYWERMRAESSSNSTQSHDHHRQSYAAAAAASTGAASTTGAMHNPSTTDDEDKKCAICWDQIENPKILPCMHKFCQPCIDQNEKTNGPKCPTCTKSYGVVTGNMPSGTMTYQTYKYKSLPGYDYCGRIEIYYSFFSGTQGPEHPNPGQYYTGTSRTAYLPDNQEGREVLKLLKEAFGRKLTFTIGTSVTSGEKNTVTWNDIHHKTSPYGGPQRYGYPDATYLKRVKDELASKGIK